MDNNIKFKDLLVIEKEMSKEEYEKNRMFNVFVFGCPRSGTSMMMGICERLGVNMVHTSDTEKKLEKRNEKERKRYGDNYQMNKDGFFEITDNPWKHLIKIMSSSYSGCKMIIPVTKDRMNVVTFKPSKVIMMWRDPEEMRQSQQASYDGNKGITEEKAEMKRARIRTNLVNQKMQLEKLGIDALHVQYQDVLKNPKEMVKKIAEFINAPNSIEEAVAWVSPEKNRFKAEELEANI